MMNMEMMGKPTLAVKRTIFHFDDEDHGSPSVRSSLD
jgi:hypothetical protein